MDSDEKSTAVCYICQHKHEVIDASHVCKQCRLFFCHPCSSSHIKLPPSKDHVIIELGRVTPAHEQEEQNRKTETDSAVADEDIVDSDYDDQGGLSTLFNAPEDVTLTKVSEFQIPSNSVRKVISLADGRICIQTGDEILIYSQDYNRQYAIECSSLFGVTFSGGNTIAILDFFLNIEKMKITDKEAITIDNVKLVIPPGICECKPTVKKLSAMRNGSPAFFFGDGQYNLVFPEMVSDKLPVWCIFSLAGMPLRQIVLSDFFGPKLVFQNLQKMYALDFRFNIRIFNRHGGCKLEFHPVDSMHFLYTDGEFIMSHDYSDNICSKNNDLVVLERGTKKERRFRCPHPHRSSFGIHQKSLDRIVTLQVFSETSVYVFGLS